MIATVTSSDHRVDRTDQSLVHSARTTATNWAAGDGVGSVLRALAVGSGGFGGVHAALPAAFGPARYSALSCVISMNASSSDASWGDSS